MSLPGSRLFHSRAITPVLRHHLPMGQLVHSQWSARRFIRYDLALRTLTARHLLAGGTTRKNIVGWYQQMYDKRGSSENLAAFQELLKIVAAEGIDPRYPVGVSKTGELLDGAQRIALALAVNEESVAVDVRRGRRLRPYGREWFRNHGFPEEALTAMDHEVDRIMATTGADTLVVTPSTEQPIQEWLPPFLPPDSEVIREWSLSLSENDVRELEHALKFVPIYDKGKLREVTHQLSEGPITIVRIRLHMPKRHRIAKTHMATDRGVIDMLRSIKAAMPDHPVVAGQTIEQNRAAMALLQGHGWSTSVGDSWE